MSRTVKRADDKLTDLIASGQVIVSLASVVKELVENAVDAGATAIDVRFIDSGTSRLDVSDNGSGIAESDFDELGRRHHTSKMRSFAELGSIKSFGFRGEAISSLAALSNLSIVTRHRNASVGTRLEMDEGGIAKRTPAAAPIGTTVSVQNLFHCLPVRKKEFERNRNRELIRAVAVLHMYGIGLEGIRLVSSNSCREDRKRLMASNGSTISDNIGSIFGGQQLESLQRIGGDVPLTAAVREEYSIGEDELNEFRLSGLISRCTRTKGRAHNDRQFLYINRRPVEIPSVLKLINQLYRQFNPQQYPFFALNISVESGENVDVNVVPSKVFSDI